MLTEKTDISVKKADICH